MSKLGVINVIPSFCWETFYDVQAYVIFRNIEKRENFLRTTYQIDKLFRCGITKILWYNKTVVVQKNFQDIF